MTGDYSENQRQKHGELFLVNPIEGGVQILYSGAVFATIEHDDRLPPGLVDRFVVHAMDLLTGRRTALWDEQVVHGAAPFDRRAARARAAASAAIDAEIREAPKP